MKSLVSVDFLTVPTVRSQVLYAFVVLAHDRRRILHSGVTAHPTAEWTAQQLSDAFPWDTAPRYLLRDRDHIFGDDFRQHVNAMGIKHVLSAPWSPWQRAYVDSVIGTIRRECLDYLILFNEASLRRPLGSYFDYYHPSRTHMAPEKDALETRPVQPSQLGRVVAVPQVGGLHHPYKRLAAGSFRTPTVRFSRRRKRSVRGDMEHRAGYRQVVMETWETHWVSCHARRGSSVEPQKQRLRPSQMEFSVATIIYQVPPGQSVPQIWSVMTGYRGSAGFVWTTGGRC